MDSNLFEKNPWLFCKRAHYFFFSFLRYTFFLLFPLFLLFISDLYATQVSYSFQPKVVRQGEPLVVEIRVEGSTKATPDRKVFTFGDVEAVFSGTSTETSIVNFKIFSHTVIRFTIVHHKDGRFQIPPITVTINGKKFTLPEEYFTVTKEKYKPERVVSPFHPFFSQNHHSDGEGIYKVRFQTNKDKVYIGEPIIGYFILYSGKPLLPMFERNPNESISFPFFLSDLLNGVSLSYPDKVDGYYTKPYGREIYALTPLKAGEFYLGKTKFDVLDTRFFRYSSKTIETEPQKIFVRELPGNPPKSFTGEVGVYEVSLEYETAEVEVGNLWKARLRFQGEGMCHSIRDPLEYSVPRSFPGKITKINTERKKSFTELRKGEYGFECEAIFEYAAQLTKDSDPFPVELSYFHPGKGTYEIKSVLFPGIRVLTQANSRKGGHLNESIDYSELGFGYSVREILSYLALAVFFLVAFLYGNKIRKIKGEKQEFLRNLDRVSGTKSGLILEKSLRKEFSESDAKFLREIKDKYTNLSFCKMYPILDFRERERIDAIIRKSKTPK